MENNEMTPMEALKNMEMFVNEEMGIKTFNQSGWHLEGSKDYDIVKQALKENAQLTAKISSKNTLIEAWKKLIEDLKKENEELKKKSQALDKALNLIKQKRDNARLGIERIYVEMKNTTNKEELEKTYIELTNQFETYTDCIITIETELGRKG